MHGKARFGHVFFILVMLSGTTFGDTNILTNPCFESGITGWTARGSGVTINTVTSPTPHGGTYCVRATGRTDVWQGIEQNVLGKMAVGATYSMSGWVRISASSGTVKISVQKTDDSGTTYTNVATVTANNTGWVQLLNNYTLTVNGTLTELLVYFEGPASGVDIYVDDTSVYGPEPVPPSSDATGSVNTNTRYQVLEGFGAAGAWYENTVLSYPEPTRTALFDTMFGQLGLDIYRVRNAYDQDGGADYISRSGQIVAAAETSLGHPIRVMISSWSPPAYLKSNDSTERGTLKKNTGGAYMYSEFAQWWANSLLAWSNAGVNAYYISMQNEPDWEADWDTCRWAPTENTTYAGYKQGFAALYTLLNGLPNRPKLLAPEGANISGTPSYIYALSYTDRSNIYGYAHHLYDGDADEPDGLNTAMANFAATYGSKPLFQTEFAKGESVTLTWTDAMNLAIFMHNSLTIEKVASYIYWELFWGSPKGLVSLTTPNYTINPVYYAFKHYSKFTDPGWQRVNASASSSNLRISSYISPDNSKLSIIAINTAAATDINLTLSLTGFTVTSSEVYRSRQTENCVLVGSFANPITLPANSITTISLTYGGDETPPAAPTGLSATAGNGLVILNWSDNTESDLAGYNIYRSTVSGGPYTKRNSSLLSSSNYTDNSVTNETTYYYVVTAEDTSLNESDNSNQVSARPYADTTPPAAPTGLAATAGEGTVALDWNNNGESDLAGYNIYRSTVSGGPYAKLNDSLLSNSDYTDNSVTNGTTYYYVVRAVDISSNQSGNSSQVPATPVNLPPAAPTGLAVTAGSGTVSLNWNDNGEGDLAGYNVYRSTTAGSGYSKLNGSLLTSSAYTDNSVNNGTTYYYVVTAADTGSNESAASSEVSAKPEFQTDVEILGTWVTGTSHVKESGVNRALIFIAHAEHSSVATLNSVSYGGQPMTKIIDTTAGSASQAYVAAYILNEDGIAAATSGTFVATWSTTPTTAGYASAFLQNVDQAAVIGATAYNGSPSGTPDPITAGPLATSAGDMVLVAATCGQPGSYELGASFTEGIDQEIASTATGVTGHKTATGESETPSVDFSNVVNRQVIIGFVVNVQATAVYPNCGEVIAAGYRLAADIDGAGDCYVNYYDLDTFVEYWLNTTCSEPDNCNGADFEPRDGAVDLSDFSDFAAQWLVCNDPQDPECPHNW